MRKSDPVFGRVTIAGRIIATMSRPDPRHSRSALSALAGYIDSSRVNLSGIAVQPVTMRMNKTAVVDRAFRKSM